MLYARVILFLVTTVGIFSLGALIVSNFSKSRAGENTWAFSLLGLMALNLIYLVRCPPPNSPGPPRLFRLIGLWFDAKEKELRDRSKPS